MLIYLQMISGEADRTKFEQVYLKYRSLMFYTAEHILHNSHDAEDAVHDAFVAIAKNIKKISKPVCPKTQVYVVTIVENKAIDCYRYCRRRPVSQHTSICYLLTGRVKEGVSPVGCSTMS